nr:hypothetical protein [Lachnospiraceae bacterium]
EMQHLMLFDETGAWDEIIEAGLFKEFANSFLIIAEKNETKAKKEKEKILYARFSNDRAKDKGIRTLVTVDSDSNPHVYKLSDSMFSDCHIKCIENTYKMLNDTYSEKMTKEDEYGGQFPKISANDYSNANDKSWELTRGRNEVIELDFVDGKTLEDLLDKNLSDGKIERFFELAKKYAAVINSARDLKKFEMTPEFKKVFGDIKSEVLQTLDATSVADIDMIPANIVVSGNEWLILDYEWTFTFPVPTNYIIYRGLHYYLASDAVGRQDVPDDIYEKLGISDEEIEVYKKMEEGFQHYVVGEHKPLSTTALMMVNKPSLHIDNMVLHTEAQVMRQYHSVVFDYGEGFDKKDEKPVENAGIYKDLKVDIPIEADYCGRTAKNLKFNLWNYDSSLIEIEELAIMTADGRELDMREKILTSAYKVDESVYYFDHGSPCIYLMDIPSDAKRFVATVKIIETDETIKQALVPKILWKRGLKKAILGKNK